MFHTALILILIAGAYAYVTIPKEAEPDVNIPILYVNLSHEGISPADAERLLIRPMEQESRDIEGVDVMRSTSFLGGANIVREFDAGFDADLALTEACMVDLSAPLDLVLAEMARRHLDSALVLKGPKLVGIFTATDACRAFAEFLRREVPSAGGDDAA